MKKLIRTILIVLGICLGLVIVKNEYGRLLMSHANYGLQALITRSEGMEENEGWDLYLGSSMFRQGLDINELEADDQSESEKSSIGSEKVEQSADENRSRPYILSYNGAQPFLIYEELEYLLAHDVPIRHAYVDMFVNSTLQEPWVEDTRLFLDTDLAFKWRLWQGMKGSRDAGFTDLWEMMVTANNEKLLTWFADYPLINGTFRDGGNLTRNTGAAREQLDRYRGSTAHDNPAFVMNGDQEEYIRKIISLCQENGIALTFLETPKYSTANEEQAYTDVMHAYCRLLRDNGVEYYLTESTVKSLAEYHGTDDAFDERHVIPFDVENPAYFIDNIHLSSEGRKEFTDSFVDARVSAERAE